MLAVLDKVAILRTVKLFDGLPFEDLVTFARIARAEAHRAGSMIFRQGEVGDCLYVLIDGSVTLALESPAGIVPIRTLKAKEYFGEMSILDGKPRSATALVGAHSLLLTLAKREFNEKIREHPDLGFELLRLLSNRVRSLQSGGPG